MLSISETTRENAWKQAQPHPAKKTAVCGWWSSQLSGRAHPIQTTTLRILVKEISSERNAKPSTTAKCATKGRTLFQLPSASSNPHLWVLEINDVIITQSVRKLTNVFPIQTIYWAWPATAQLCSLMEAVKTEAWASIITGISCKPLIKQ